jgi:hypothetical protein
MALAGLADYGSSSEEEEEEEDEGKAAAATLAVCKYIYVSHVDRS